MFDYGGASTGVPNTYCPIVVTGHKAALVVRVVTQRTEKYSWVRVSTCATAVTIPSSPQLGCARHLLFWKMVGGFNYGVVIEDLWSRPLV